MINSISEVLSEYSSVYYAIKDMGLNKKAQVMEGYSNKNWKHNEKLEELLKTRGVINEMIDKLLAEEEIDNEFNQQLSILKGINKNIFYRI